MSNHTSPTGHNACGSCRRCCQGTLVRVYDEDIERWKKEGRYDIILCLETILGMNSYLIHKKDRDECIFLGKDGCEIYPTRPRVCRGFPSSWKQVHQYRCTQRPTKED